LALAEFHVDLGSVVRHDTRKHCFGQQVLANFCLQGMEAFGRYMLELNATLVVGQLH
jgi:hypothetical protein